MASASLRTEPLIVFFLPAFSYMRTSSYRFSKAFSNIIWFIPILFYVGFIIFSTRTGQYPVDFETFLDIGTRFIHGQNPYGVNSLYPMPYVGIFGLFALLPKSMAFILWYGGQILAALLIAGPWVLLFTPVFAAQASALGMIALWGYRNHRQDWIGGIWLAVMLIKPQLAIAALAYAGFHWMNDLRKAKRIPKQTTVFAAALALVYLPWFLVRPNWVVEWLANPRGLRERAMAAILPRLLYYLNLRAIAYWLLIIAITLLMLWLMRKQLTLDKIVLLSFVVSPLLHDYDLIQLVPIIDTRAKQRLAILASLPLWVTTLFFYSSDHAWLTATLIAPILLIGSLGERVTPKIGDTLRL